MGKHIWESDEQYAGRVNKEANEKTIEESTGKAPSRRLWEDDSAYRDRVGREATEQIIERSTGSAPSQSLWESKDNYRKRINQEANESIIADSSGSSPSRRIFESHDAYRSRISREANEQIIESATGSGPSKGLFESDSAYRHRLYTQSREIRASGSGDGGRDSSSSNVANGDHGTYSGRSSGNSAVVWGVIFVALAIMAILGIVRESMVNDHNVAIPKQDSHAPKPSPRRHGLSPEDRLQHQFVAQARRLLREEDYAAALAKCNEALVLKGDDAATLQLKEQIESAMQAANTQGESTDAQKVEPDATSGFSALPSTELVPRGETSSPSQESNTTRDNGASELLARVQIALGGNDRLSSIRDWRQEVIEAWEPRRGTSQQATYFSFPSTMRTEVIGGNKVVNFSDGESGWSWSSTSKNVNDLPTETASGMTLHNLPALLLNDIHGHTATMVAPGVVELSDKFNDTARLTIDLSTYLPEKLAWTNRDGATLEETYSDWRSINGVLWWFQMTRSRDGVIFLRERVKDYRINTGISAASLATRP
jgi:hypothetical protein